MDLYHVLLFVHIAAAIVLVGGSLAADLVGHLARKAATVESLRGLVNVNATLAKFINAAAPVVLLAGIYLAFAGSHWSSGWVPVSLALFLLAGAIAFSVIDPGVKKMVAALSDVPDGPVGPAVGMEMGRIAAPVAFAGSTMVGIDMAILFLMTNKPGYTGAGAVAAVGIGFGLTLAMRGRRHASSPAAPPAAAA